MTITLNEFSGWSQEPPSPLDPYPYPCPRAPFKEPQDEFLDSVILDSPRIAQARRPVGTTRPLRVRKHVPPRIAGLGPGARHRRSTASVPQSPRSLVPSSPRISRTNTTSSTSSSMHPHHSISRLFLSGSPTVLTPTGLPLRSSSCASVTSTSVKFPAAQSGHRTPSLRSELHLSLGVSQDDGAGLLPSPPPSPLPSPLKREFVAPPPPPPPHNKYPRDKDLPKSPVTPSRAPPKAAKLLGAAFGEPLKRPKQAKKRDHFRPLPTETLVEIERLFGEAARATPRKPHSSTKAFSYQATPLKGSSGDGIGPRNIGQGQVVRYQGQDGRMWLDVEEEQEFAWLLSEIFSVNPQPLPQSLLSNQPKQSLLESGDHEKAWGMESFTSVLSMRRPPPMAPPKATLKSKKFKHHDDPEESFLNFGPRAKKYTSVPSPPSTASTASPGRPNHAQPSDLATSVSSRDSLPYIPYVKPALTRSTSSESSDTDTCNSDSSGSRPRKAKTRPPPLTLSNAPRKPNLPTVSTTPTATYPKQTAPEPRPVSLNPQTPFVRPRPAPVPPMAQTNPCLLPPMPVRCTISLDSPIGQVSYIEPETPTQAAGKFAHHRVLSGGAAAAASAARAGAKQGVTGVKNSGAWLKKVVKPLAYTRI